MISLALLNLRWTWFTGMTSFYHCWLVLEMKRKATQRGHTGVVTAWATGAMCTIVSPCGQVWLTKPVVLVPWERYTARMRCKIDTTSSLASVHLHECYSSFCNSVKCAFLRHIHYDVKLIIKEWGRLGLPGNCIHSYLLCLAILQILQFYKAIVFSLTFFSPSFSSFHVFPQSVSVQTGAFFCKNPGLVWDSYVAFLVFSLPLCYSTTTFSHHPACIPKCIKYLFRPFVSERHNKT